MTEKTWLTDEFGNKTWSCQGWVLKIWAFCDSDVDITGPGDEEVWLDHGVLAVKHETHAGGWEGSSALTTHIPLDVLREILRLGR